MTKELYSKNKLALELGVDRRTLDARLDGISPTKVGARNAQQYTLKQVFDAFLAHAAAEVSTKRRSILPSGKSEDSDVKAHNEALASAKLRRELADAELAEIKVAKERGLLIEASRVGDIWDDLTATMRTRMLSLPNRLSAETEGMDRRAVERRAEELVHEALQELNAPADYTAEQSDVDDDNDDAD